MRFLLLEKIPEVSKDLQNHWKYANAKERREIANQIISEFGDPGLDTVKDAIIYSFDNFGIDPDENKFFSYFDKLGKCAQSRYSRNVYKLVDMVLHDEIDLGNLDKHFFVPSFYDRNIEEFEFTAKAFDVFTHPEQLSKYFKDTTGMEPSLLYADDGTILPAGNESTIDDENTIYGMIQSLSNGGENDVNSNHNSDSNNYTLYDFCKKINLSIDRVDELIPALISKYYNDTDEIYRPKKSMNDYMKLSREVINGGSSSKKSKLTTKQIQKIKSQKSYNTVSEIPPYEEKYGNVVFVNTVRGNNDKYGRPILNMSNQRQFVAYNGSEWDIIDPDEYSIISVENEYGSNVRKEFLSSKILSTLTDKIRVTADIEKFLDTKVDTKRLKAGGKSAIDSYI